MSSRRRAQRLANESINTPVLWQVTPSNALAHTLPDRSGIRALRATSLQCVGNPRTLTRESREAGRKCESLRKLQQQGKNEKKKTTHINILVDATLDKLGVAITLDRRLDICA